MNMIPSRHVLSLSNELLLLVCRHIPHPYISNFAQTCKHIYHLLDVSHVLVDAQIKYVVGGYLQDPKLNWAPLPLSARAGSLKALTRILSNPSGDYPLELTSALEWACVKGHLEACKQLLDAGAHVSTIGHSNALLLAAKNGHASICELLIEQAGCDPKAEPDDWHNTNHRWHCSDSEDDPDDIGMTVMHWVAWNGLSDLCQKLIYKGCKADEESYMDGRTPLMLAAYRGHAETCKVLVEYGNVDVDYWAPEMDEDNPTPYWHSKPPLLCAMEQGHIETVQALIDLGASLKKLWNGFSVISHAARIGNLAVFEVIVEYMRKYKLPIDKAEGKEKTTSLITAASHGSIEICRYILTKCGTKTLNQGDKSGNTPLHFASGKNHSAIVKMLIQEYGVDKECKNATENTPFVMACIHGAVDTARILIQEFHCDIEVRNTAGQTPLLRAIDNEKPQVVELLLKSGCSITKLDGKGTTAMEAAVRALQPDIMQLLATQRPESLETLDDDEFTPLMWAAGGPEDSNDAADDDTDSDDSDDEDDDEAGKNNDNSNSRKKSGSFTSMLKKLISLGAKVNIIHGGWTPLSRAVIQNRPLHAAILIEEGKAKLDAASNNSSPLLYDAIMEEGVGDKVIQCLIDHGAPLDEAVHSSTDPTCPRPLHAAISSKRVSAAQMIARALVDRRMGLEGTDRKGRTYLFLAVEMGMVDVAKELVRLGANQNVADKSGTRLQNIARGEAFAKILKFKKL